MKQKGNGYKQSYTYLLISGVEGVEREEVDIFSLRRGRGVRGAWGQGEMPRGLR